MKRSNRWTTTASIALALSVAGVTGLAVAPASVLAQSRSDAPTHSAKPAAPRDSAASMAVAPEAASGSGGKSNPDNMPIKQPNTPSNDRIVRPPPASGANAK